MVRRKTGTKRGRRVLPEQRKKSIVVSVRLAAGQKEELENAAKAKGWKLSKEISHRLRFPPKDVGADSGPGRQLGKLIARMATQAEHFYGRPWHKHYRVAATIAYGCMTLLRDPDITPPGTDTTTPEFDAFVARMQEVTAATTAENYAPHILGGMLAMQIKAQLKTESSHQYGNGIEANDDPSRIGDDLGYEQKEQQK